MEFPDSKFTPHGLFQVLNSISDIVIIKGPGSRFLWANKAFCEYYNMTPEQLLGIIDAPHAQPDITEKYVRDDTYVFSTGKNLDIPEEIIMRHDGEARTVHTIKVPIRNEEGKVIQLVAICRDLTMIKRAEDRLALERAKAIHSAKMVSLGEMASGVAHELNSPLAAVNLLVDQMTDLLKKPEPNIGKITEVAGKIELTIDRVAKIVAGLLTFSHESKEEEFSQVDLRQVIEGTLLLCRERLKQHSIALLVSELSAPVLLKCSEVQLSQILMNLLNNAHDAVVSAEGEKWVRVECVESANDVKIMVSNSGPLIDPQVSNKMFQPFFTTKEIGKGIGLGLSISMGIAKAHRGTIELDSSCANTRFVVYLPKK